MKNKIIKLALIPLLCIVAAISPLFFGIVYAFKLPKQYNETYLAAMSDKMKLLKAPTNERIVLIGGSNLPFSIDSFLLEEKLEREVINFGLYAGLGSKIMLDLARTGLKKGDTVIFSIEYSTQTLSNYINAENTLQMLDTDFSLSHGLKATDMLQIYGKISEFIQNKRKYIELGVKPNSEGIYSRSAFNAKGDIKISRSYNIMPDMYNSSDIVEFDTNIISQDFIDYFNSFSKWANRKDIEVLMSFPSFNRLAVSSTATEEKRLEFYDFIANNFDAKVISSIDDYIIHEDYFYDSNYHLNDSGVILRTDKLLGDIKRHYNDTSANNIAVPEGSGANPESENETEITEGNDADNFTYEEADGKITITGLSNKGKALTELKIPSLIEGKPVNKIAAGAFNGCTTLVALTIPSSVKAYESNLFEGAPSLTRVNLLLGADISAALPQVGQSLLVGANPNLKIYVPKNWYGKITTDYFWGVYANRIEII